MSALKRNITLYSAISIVVGGVIGSGIFMKPALMASQLGSPLLLLSVWVVAGIITLFGALGNAEVAAMFPETGGQFVFFKKMYGDGFASLYGWVAFSIYNTAGNASIAYICAQYIDYFAHLPRLTATAERAASLHIPLVGHLYPLEHIGLKVVTVAIVVLLSAANYVSVQGSAAIQRLLTSLKAVAMMLLIGGLLTSRHGSVNSITTPLPAIMPQGLSMVGAYMAAVAGAFWAYDGWNNIIFVAGEIEEPQKNIPRSLLTGMLFCMGTYLLINLAFVYVMPIGKMSASTFIAADAAGAAWGVAGAGIIAVMVILSTFGATNANVMASARITYALGQDNRLFGWAGRTHPRYHTPGNALWLNAAWSTLLIITGSFDMLTDMLIFVIWFFYGMSALGVLILRHRMPGVPRPYKVPGYPAVPVIFFLFAAFFLITTLYTDIVNYRAGRANTINSLLGVLITCIGIPVYLFRKK